MSGAQCPIDWLPAGNVAGMNGRIDVVHRWDPDGLGPVAAAGSATFDLAVPRSPVLVGSTWFHQYLQAEVDAAAAIVSLSASNGLVATVGWF